MNCKYYVGNAAWVTKLVLTMSKQADLWGLGMQGKVLVINCGSSSAKFAVIIADNGNIFAEGIAKCLFMENPVLRSPKH
jgi:hypothetical protein